MLVYQNDLSGEAAGAMQGLTNYSSGTFQISSGQLAETSSGDGHQCLIKSIPSLQNFDIQYTINPSDTDGQLGLIFRADATNDNGYLLWWDGTDTTLSKKVSGTYSVILAKTRVHAYTASDLVNVRVSVSGTSIQLKAWITTDNEPSFQYSWTDSTFSASGFFGLNQTSAAQATLTNISFVNNTSTLNSISPIGSSLFFSPYVWRTVGNNRIQSANPGSYFKCVFTGTSFTAVFDIASVTSGIVSPANWPKFGIQVDGGAWSTIQLTQSITTLASGLSDTTHTIRVVIKMDIEVFDRWTGPDTALRLLAVAVDAGKTITAPTIKPLRAIFYGDSITEGVYVDAALYVSGNNSMSGYAFLIGDRLNSEFGIVGFGATGWVKSGNGNVPGLNGFWDDYSSGYSRLSGGLLSPLPDYIFVNEGTNEDGSADATIRLAVTNQIQALRTAAPLAKIYIIIPFRQNKATAISNGILDAADSKTVKIDLQTAGVTYSTSEPTYSNDGLHPNAAGHVQLANLLFSEMFGGSGSGRGLQSQQNLQNLASLN